MRALKRFILGLLAFIFFVVLIVGLWIGVHRVRAVGEEVRIAQHDAPTAHQVPSKKGRLRVATFNIAHGRGLAESNWERDDRTPRLQAIGEFLQKEGADLVVLNEVDFGAWWSGDVNQAEVIAHEGGYPYWAEQRNVDFSIPFAQWTFGNAVLSRYPIVVADLVELPDHAKWEWAVFGGMRDALRCVVELPNGTEVVVLAVHLDHRSPELRVAAAHDLHAAFKDFSGVTIVAGDLNDDYPEGPKAEANGAGLTALSVLREQTPLRSSIELPHEADEYTYPTSSPDRVLDWILATPPAKMKRHHVPKVEFSDHLPVVVDVIL